MNWYYKLLAKRPYLVLLGVAVFSLACIVTSFVCNKLPDFTDPTVVSSRSFLFYAPHVDEHTFLLLRALKLVAL